MPKAIFYLLKGEYRHIIAAWAGGVLGSSLSKSGYGDVPVLGVPFGGSL